VYVGERKRAINVSWKENEVPIMWFKKRIMVGMQSHLYAFDGTQSKTITLSSN
jgi:hypothetical protein